MSEFVTQYWFSMYCNLWNIRNLTSHYVLDCSLNQGTFIKAKWHLGSKCSSSYSTQAHASSIIVVLDLLFTNLWVHGFIEDVVVVQMASAFMITFLHALRAKDRSTSSSSGVLSSGNFFKISRSSMKVSSAPRLMAASFCVGRKASTRCTTSSRKKTNHHRKLPPRSQKIPNLSVKLRPQQHLRQTREVRERISLERLNPKRSQQNHLPATIPPQAKQ
jgi:hypothetical protein